MARKRGEGWLRRGTAEAVALATVLLVAFGGCSNEEEAAAPLQVVTTVAPLTSIVSDIVGEHAAGHRPRPRRHQQPHIRATAFGRGPPGRCGGGVPQRSRAGGADPGAGGRQRGRRHPDRGARQRDDLPGGVHLRLLLPRGGRHTQPPPVDQPADGGSLRRDRGRHDGGARSRTRRGLQGEPERVPGEGRRARRGDARRHRDGPSRPAPAAHLPRRLRLLRRTLRMERHRGHPAIQLRRAHRARRGRAHRPGAGRGGAGDLRIGGVPLAGARADRPGDRCPLRRRAARRRPPRRVGGPGALLARPDALRLRHDGQGARRRAERALEAVEVSDVVEDRAEYPQ